MDDLEGGLGGESTTVLGIRDARMIEQAVQQRWPIPEHIRAALPQIMGEILIDTKTSKRHKIAAAKTLISADNSNLKAEATAAIQKLEQEVDERRELVETGGINVRTGEPTGGSSAAKANGSDVDPEAKPDVGI